MTKLNIRCIINPTSVYNEHYHYIRQFQYNEVEVEPQCTTHSVLYTVWGIIYSELWYIVYNNQYGIYCTVRCTLYIFPTNEHSPLSIVTRRDLWPRQCRINQWSATGQRLVSTSLSGDKWSIDGYLSIEGKPSYRDGYSASETTGQLTLVD